MKHCGTRIIETPRLLLRPFCSADAEAIYHNWASDPQVTRYLTWRFHESIRESERLLKEWLGNYRHKNYYQWAVVLRSLGEPIGSIGCAEVDRRHQVFELGYCMGKKWWGNGLMTEAANAVVDYMFHDVKCRRIIARYARENGASRRVMEKIGMLPALQEAETMRTVNGIFTCPVYEIDAAFRLLK